MVLRTLGPRSPINQFRQEMDRLLTGFLGGLPGDATSAVHQPALNAWEEEDSLFVEMELPGVKADGVDISVVENQLSIKVERPEQTDGGVTYHRRERGAGAFTRILRLPVEVDADGVSAELQHGVLTVTLPKAPSARPRKIAVATAGA